MRVVRVLSILEPGGAQLAIARLSRELRRRGVETRVLAGSATREGIELLEAAGVEVDAWTEQPPLPTAAASPELQYACSEEFVGWLAPRLRGADIVHAHMFGAWWAAAMAVPDGVPLAASEHNAVRWPDAPRHDEMRAALARVDRFFAHGPATGRMVLELGYPRERLRRGVSPVEPGRPRPLAGLPVPRIVFAGRLHEEKGPDLLIDAVSRMRVPPPTQMLGAGPGMSELREQVARLGLEGTVRFWGWRSGVGRWLARASACVVPSRHEAWSQTAVLAMRLGVPVVGTAVEGLPLTLHRRRGVLVPPEDPEALARAIEDVVSGRVRPDLRRARRYAGSFTPRRVATLYAREYLALSSQREAPIALARAAPLPVAGSPPSGPASMRSRSRRRGAHPYDRVAAAPTG
jgi:glycosyltransferase involved in cell wall biosynthesis